MVVGDDNLGALDIAQHVGRRYLAAAIVAFGIVRQQNTQPVPDRDAWRNDKEPARELFAVRVTHGVDRLPGDQHCHHGSLARTGRQFQCKTHQFRIGLFVRPLDMRPELGDTRPHLGRNLGQPDGSFHRFNLAKKRTDALELVVPPMFQQAGGLWCDQPLIRVWQAAPGFDIAPDLVNDRGWVVFLICRRKIVVCTKKQCALFRVLPLLFGLWNWSDEVRASPIV